MHQHHFYRSNFDTVAHPQAPTKISGCDSFAVYQQAHPGKFIVLPEGYSPCKPGFRPYQRDSDGKIVGLKLD